MEWTEYTLGLVQALAWPLTIGLLGFSFRKQISSRIEALSKMDAWGVSLSFQEQLKKLEQGLETQAITLPPPTNTENFVPDAPKYSASEPSRFEKIAEVAPALAILDTWAKVEEELSRIGLARGYGDRPVTFLLRRLREDGLLDRSVYNSIDQLWSLRNAAAHARPTEIISTSDAARFEKVASEIVSRLQDVS